MYNSAMERTRRIGELFVKKLASQAMTLLVVALFIRGNVWGQTAQAGDAGGISNQLSESFSGKKLVQQVQLSGNAIWHTGGTEDTGTISLSAKSNGSSQMKVSLSAAGEKTESQTGIGLGARCQWTGSSGALHGSSSSGCAIITLWFLPALSMQSSLLPSNLLIADQGIETIGQGATLYHHLQIHLATANTSNRIATAAAAQSKTDIGLNTESNLPAILAYSVRPDNGSPVVISVEVRYSDYRAVDGVQIPFHIQRYVNGALQLDILISSAQIN